jgi:propanediol utilization protein
MEVKVSIEVSARHIHLCRKDMDILFGKGCKLTKLKDLGQPSDFSAKETVDLMSGDRKFENVRVVGPLRKETQAELSITDAVYLKINPPVRLSGDLKGSAGVSVIGPKGRIDFKKGVIISQRHIHCNPEEAEKLGLKNGSDISIATKGDRSVVFNNVAVRVSFDYRLAMHIDTDEGNAAGINKIGEGIII